MPLCYYLTFDYKQHPSLETYNLGAIINGLGSPGLYIGISVACFFNIITQFLILYFSDWDHIAYTASEKRNLEESDGERTSEPK